MAQDPDEETGGTAVRLREARPPVDPARLATQLAKVEGALFRISEPARLARFVLLDTIGSGGMGVVYRAYDPQLDRKVALKLLHPRAGGGAAARQRLLTEARALGKLRHPNVVTVHEVVELDEQVVLVMELVEGETLAAWERARRPRWRDVVGAYAAAGRGLAAVHALGLIHRDFKPSNVIVGDDGRVRVLDFGLARVTPEADATDEALGSGVADLRPIPEALTATGDVIGTLAYMSPEQLAGEPATAASDQFAFCVALYQAVFGVRPFAGDTTAARHDEIRSGRIASPAADRHPPRWLRAQLVRGLAFTPAERHPSMGQLVEQLERDRGWRRVGFVAPPVVLAAAAVLAFAWTRPPADPLAACDAADPEIEAAWGAARRDEVRRAFVAVDTPAARAVTDRVVGALDTYRDAWVRGHRDACIDQHRGALAPRLVERRALCLHRRKSDLAAAARVLAHIDRTSVANATDVVSGLPPLAWCHDVEVLSAEVDPPPRAIADEVAALRVQLSEAAALERAGITTPALERTLAAGERAAALGYAPVQIEAGLIEGRLRLFRQEYDDAVASLVRTEALALQHGNHRDAVVAGARRIWLQGAMGRDLTGLLRQAEVLEPLSRGLTGDGFARPLLLNNLGTVHMQRGDRAAARAAYEAAREALADVAEPDLELTCIDQNLAMLTPDPEQRVALIRSAWERLRDALGAEHLTTLRARFNHARYEPSPARALPLIEETCDAYERAHPELIAVRAECDYYRAWLTAEVLGPAAAADRYASIATLVGTTNDLDARTWAGLGTGHAHLLRGDPASALAAFAAVTAGRTDGSDVGTRLYTAEARLGTGLASRALGDAVAAHAALSSAVCTFTDLAALSESGDLRNRLAQARAGLLSLPPSIVRNESPCSGSAPP